MFAGSLPAFSSRFLRFASSAGGPVVERTCGEPGSRPGVAIITAGDLISLVMPAEAAAKGFGAGALDGGAFCALPGRAAARIRTSNAPHRTTRASLPLSIPSFIMF
jgi:hypothetical protein